ncbi:MAG TPA: ATP-dependent helicase, partial [Acidobacteriota bacterium]|nr:ATP-dependent helicase [Acidobacteriota bacterium]
MIESLPLSGIGSQMAASEELDVYTLEGPALLLAGPGTGKTYQLAKRIKYLVESRKVDPGTITVITFTAAAAANMRARISDLRKPELYVCQDLQPKLVCTMHSLGNRIIHDNLSLINMSVTPAVVQADRTKLLLMSDAAQVAGYRREAAEETKICRQYGKCQPEGSRKCKICKTYEQILRSCGTLDYDDQILLACRVLRENPVIAERWRKRTRHLLIDEYQDINAGQFELIRTLCHGQEDGLFVVGDDDQSIYSWRGGSPKFIRGFEEHFGTNSRVAPLRHSFRCPKSILESGFSVIKQYDRNRRDKGSFFFDSGEGSPITVHSAPSDKSEAAEIKAIVADALPSKDVLILLPNRNYARLICEALRRSRISFVAPESIPGEGLPVVERFIVWFYDPQDSLALRDCIENMLVGERSPVPSSRVRKPEKLELREKGFAAVSSLWKEVINKGRSLWEALNEVQSSDPVIVYLRDGFKALGAAVETRQVATVLSNIAELLRPWRSIADLVEEIQNWVSSSDQGSSGQIPSVRVMTFQGAKGLEADVVCIVGTEEGAIPHDVDDGELLAEQARLFFVTMTRARNKLHIFHTRNRSGAVSYT